MPLVSFIVPVYKVEKYLDRCVESIVNQTCSDWELLLIDDGSPDNSGEICDRWAENDNRVKVIHQPNKGVSAARNIGLDNASGEWIMFVDSDDWITNICIEKCLSVAEKYELDLLQFGIVRVLGDVIQEPQDKTSTEVLTHDSFIEWGKFRVSIGGSFIKRSVIEGPIIRMEVGMKLGEDQLFIMNVIDNSTRLMKISDVLYYYYFNPCSAVNNPDIPAMMNSINILLHFRDEHPIFNRQVDKCIAGFFCSILAQKKSSIKDVVRLLYNCIPLNGDFVELGGSKLLVKIGNVSPIVACLIMKLKYAMNSIMQK